MRYYRLNPDVGVEGRWFLAEPRLGGVIPDGYSIWNLWDTDPLPDKTKLHYDIQDPGGSLDITIDGFENMVLSKSAAGQLRKIVGESCSFHPVQISGKSQEFFLLKILKSISCIDFGNSIVDYFPNNHEKGGQVRTVYSLAVDVDKLSELNPAIFRILDYPSIIVVSDNFKQVVSANKLSGCIFEKVS